MMKGFLIVILSIHLFDKYLKMNLYKVYNLPPLHPDLKVQIYIPSKNNLTTEIDTSSRYDLFVGCNVIYQNIT